MVFNSQETSLCRMKRLADCMHQALGRGIAKHFKELTGLEIHLQHGGGAVPWCPEATQLRAGGSGIQRRCAICAKQIWQSAAREKAESRVFVGACGRKNCLLSIIAADSCALCLVIQTPPPQTVMGISYAAPQKPLTNLAETPEPGSDCESGAESFDQPVTLLKLVARGLASEIKADELRWTLEKNQRVLQTLLARDMRLQRVLKKILPEIPDTPVPPEDLPNASRLVEQVRDFLLQNYQSPAIGLAEAAANVHRSASYVSMLFSRETGVSFHSYLQELRLTKAKDLLHDPRLSVEEVAQASGYASAGWFRHSFKHHVGLSPSDWRRSRLHS